MLTIHVTSHRLHFQTTPTTTLTLDKRIKRLVVLNCFIQLDILINLWVFITKV